MDNKLLKWPSATCHPPSPRGPHTGVALRATSSAVARVSLHQEVALPRIFQEATVLVVDIREYSWITWHPQMISLQKKLFPSSNHHAWVGNVGDTAIAGHDHVVRDPGWVDHTQGSFEICCGWSTSQIGVARPHRGNQVRGCWLMTSKKSET